MKKQKKIRLASSIILGLTLIMNFSISVDFERNWRLPVVSINAGGVEAYAQGNPDCGSGSFYFCGYHSGIRHLPAYHNGWVAAQ